MTETTPLFSDAILLSAGICMHGKSNAEVWQRYVKVKFSTALSRRSVWFLFLLSFPRCLPGKISRRSSSTRPCEPKERAQPCSLRHGAAAGLLAVIAWSTLRNCAWLSITQFFLWISVLIAILAVMLACKGIAGLQEAGILGVPPLADVPRIEVLGLFPTTECVVAQIGAILVLAAGLWISGRSAAEASVPTSSPN